jgi:uncharacterized LabA/DUF88 family protein
MIKSFIRGKTAVFIDASNIYFSQRRLRWQVDFVRLMKYFKKETDLWNVFFYTAYDSTHKKQKKFIDFLEIAGYIVRTKKVKFIKDKEKGGFRKGNLDVELTIDAVHNKDKFKSFLFRQKQTCLLFSGDSDFEALIKYLKRYHKRCLVFSTKDHVSIELVKQAKFIDIKKLKCFISK